MRGRPCLGPEGGTMGFARRFLLPLPACGERVGVRGSIGGFGLAESPLTRRASRVDLSPQAGRGGSRGSVRAPLRFEFSPNRSLQ